MRCGSCKRLVVPNMPGDDMICTLCANPEKYGQRKSATLAELANALMRADLTSEKRSKFKAY